MSIEPIFLRQFDQHLSALRAEHERLLEDNQRLRKQLHDWNEEEALDELVKELVDARRRSLTQLTDAEIDAADSFRSEHYEKCHKYQFGYFMDNTGIGRVLEIQCCVCGEKKDITDYEAW